MVHVEAKGETAQFLVNRIFCIGRNNDMAAVYSYAFWLEMSRRDLQLDALAKQRQWDLGNDVEHSAVVSTITGTPAGVGAVVPGETIKGTIAGLSPVAHTIGAVE